MIFLFYTVETGFKPVSTKPNHGLSEFVRAFKTFSSRRINAIRQTTGTQVWQLRFYDRIIRTASELNKIRVQKLKDNNK